MTGLAMNDRVEPSGESAVWKSSISISGKSEGENPKEDVDSFVSGFKNGAGLSNVVVAAGVDEFTADSFNPKHRVFKLSIELKPFSFAGKDETAKAARRK